MRVRRRALCLVLAAPGAVACGQSGADDLPPVDASVPLPVFVLGDTPSQRIVARSWCWARECATGEPDPNPVTVEVEPTGMVELRLDAAIDLADWRLWATPAREDRSDPVDDPLSVRPIGVASWEIDLGDWPGGVVDLFAAGPGGDIAAAADLRRPDTHPANGDPGSPSAELVPSWAGDHSMPPPLVVRGLNEVSLTPWTWGWTSPPNDNGKQESTVADGTPPDPLDIVEHDGVIELVYPLDGWTFTARIEPIDATTPLDVVSVADGIARIDVGDAPSPADVWIVGRATPGYYELNVSFTLLDTSR